MKSTFTVSTDKEEKIQLESGIIEASWVSPVAYGGFEAKFKVTTVFVAEGSTIEIKGKSSKGKAPDKVKGKVFNNCFKGSMLIPEKVAPDADIWFEAKLPKHGLKMESNVIPARPAIGVKKLAWNCTEVARKDIVTLTCQFEEGALDGDEAVFVIYEHNPDTCDLKLISIPAEVKGNKAEIQWEFDYLDDTALIPTEFEKSAVQKKYVNPRYYFIVSVNGVRAGEKQESGLLTFRDSIIITVQHGNSTLVEEQEYTITFADGREVKKRADKNSQILIEDATPGPFTILHKGRQVSDCIPGKTGTPLVALFPDTCLLIDAHMHIQSNNCCPLPLQWAIVAEKAGFLLGRPNEDSRKKVNDTTAGLLGSFFAGRLGKIGRLSTDMISQLYKEKLYNADMKQELCWTILSDKELKKYKDSPDEMRKIAGEKATLTKLSAVSAEEYEQEFVEKTRYYFEGNRIHRMNIALLMDLSFSHYWGRFGLPLYLSHESHLYYINDFASVGITQWEGSDTTFVRLDESVVTPKIRISSELGNAGPGLNSFSRMHLFPNYASGETAAFGTSSFYASQFELSMRNGARSAGGIPLINFDQTEQIRSLSSRNYIHFVDKAPEEDTMRFEDYAIQRERSIAAAIMNPVSLFAFYHYDPRRHCITVRKTAQSIAQDLLKDHAFFTLKENKKHSITSNGVHYSGCIDATAHTAFNDSEKLSEKLEEHLRSNDDAFSELHLHNTSGSGMFWGVKMYPRLGFSPSDFYHYPELESFYTACEAKKIPITAHCAPGGMAIADYFLNERYDEKRYLDSKSKNGKYDLNHAAARFDGVIAGTTGKDSPARWEEVLLKFKNLKLNLAHFGSSDTWRDAAGFEKNEKTLAGRKMGGAKELHYDDVDRYRDWVKKIAQLVQKYDNVYTDISFFVNKDPHWFFKVGHDRDDVAKDLIYLLKKYPSLKHRLLMGSDWYMIEMDKEKGIGDYFRKMFFMLRTVSEEVGYDAWHQFSVVNPLMFLGLIDDAKGSEGPYSVKTEALEKLKVKFEKKITDSLFTKITGCKINSDKVQNLFEETLSLLKNIKVSSGEQIVRNKQLTILQPNED